VADGNGEDVDIIDYVVLTLTLVSKSTVTPTLLEL
jgi:hypothetical protein